jgi:hypothetical protein
VSGLLLPFDDICNMSESVILSYLIAAVTDMKNNFEIPIRLIVIIISVILLSGCSLAQRGALDRAYRAHREGDHWKALEKLSDAESYTKPTPEMGAEILFLRASCFESLGRSEDAIGVYKHIIENYPETAYASQARIKLRINENDLEIKKDPDIKYKEQKYLTTTTDKERDLLYWQNWAVIIGISKYKYSGKNGINDLIFADDDAKAFARVLINKGWENDHIKLLLNEEATLRNIMIALESWLTKATSNDRIVLFWAGHGFADPEDSEKVYLACYDTDISIPATGYRMDKVRAALEEREARNVILFADTCHAGKLITRGDRGLSIVPQIKKMRRERDIPKGWIFMVGADTDREAIEHSSWKNGAFTHCLVKALNGEADGYESVGPKDGIVTMAELRAYLNSAMPEETQRVFGKAKRPVITTSTGDPDIWNLSLQTK